MTVLVGMLGGPGCGKTSISAKLFAHLKAHNVSVEFANEYIKGWAWEGRSIGLFDQFYAFGKEVHYQSRLFNKVDFIISDSPAMLAAFYQHFYNNDGSLDEASKNFYKLAEEKANVKFLHFLLPRKKEYVEEGRFQTKEEADKLSIDLKKWLDSEKYAYTELDCEDEERLDVILENLEKFLGKKLDGFYRL